MLIGINTPKQNITFEKKGSVSLVDRSVELFLNSGQSNFDNDLLFRWETLLDIFLHSNSAVRCGVYINKKRVYGVMERKVICRSEKG